MKEAVLQLELRSTATFGRGDGVAGLVDSEIEHDQNGFPFLRGRTLKGLLFEAAEDLVFAFKEQGEEKWKDVRDELFGRSGSNTGTQGILHVGDAQIAAALRTLMLAERNASGDEHYHKDEILAAFTGIRRQTAMNPYGGPEHGSLRSLRVVLRNTVLTAALSFARAPEPDEWALLTGATLGLKAAGTGRNRGRGRLRATLNDEAFMRQYLERL
jgi:hypothetical protein